MVNLNKIELTKKGQSVNLEKKNAGIGQINVNLNWNQQIQKPSGGFLSSLFGSKNNSIDLDLGCLFELKNGDKGCVQALGNSFGNYREWPYIELDGDDRTGSVSNGENLRINGDFLKEIKRIVIFSFIYQGVTNWAQADGVVTLSYEGGQDIVVPLDEHRSDMGMCAIAMIENVNDETFKVERFVEYFNGHEKLDRAYGWGMNWTPGRK